MAVWVTINSEADLPKESGWYVVDLGDDVKMARFDNEKYYIDKWVIDYTRWLNEGNGDIILYATAAWDAAEKHWKEMLDENSFSPCTNPDKKNYFKQTFNIDL